MLQPAMSRSRRIWDHMVDKYGKLKDIGEGGSGSGGAGPRGVDGTKGQKGDAGAVGAAGSAGCTGVKGQKGAEGHMGENGGKGQKGAQGPSYIGSKGDKGESASIPATIIHASWDASAEADFDWNTHQIAHYGIASVIRTAKGIFDVTFTTAMASADYTAVASAGDQNYGGIGASPRAMNVLNRTTTGFTVICERTDDAAQDDCGYIAFIVFAPTS